ncbi:hypothetical protein [uncultured Limnobacter sp.]|uniref:hypothetical protein n=1 Tax=uncultured Limnobacter sp. TaxID=199681 RepID=UPI0032B24230
MNENIFTTSCKLRRIKDALAPAATAARLGLDRIILEVEILEDCRVAMNRTIKEGLHQPPAQHEPPMVAALTEQQELGF